MLFFFFFVSFLLYILFFSSSLKLTGEGTGLESSLGRCIGTRPHARRRARGAPISLSFHPPRPRPRPGRRTRWQPLLRTISSPSKEARKEKRRRNDQGKVPKSRDAARRLRGRRLALALSTFSLLARRRCISPSALLARNASAGGLCKPWH